MVTSCHVKFLSYIMHMTCSFTVQSNYRYEITFTTYFLSYVHVDLFFIYKQLPHKGSL